MKYMLAGVLSFPALIAIAAFSADAAEGVPVLDVSTSCQDEAAVAPERKKQCMQDEQSAREVLVREWEKFDAADRRQCSAVATLGGTSSYVELLTCLQMAMDARKLPPNDR
jgi:hypothetical protein